MGSRHDTYTVDLFCGLTGSGKTTFAMGQGVDHVATRGVPMYTNIGFSTDGLRHHLLRRYGRRFGRRVGLHRLIIRLEEDQVGEFWKHVPPDALIVIDEAQIYFPQSAQKTGQHQDLVKYLTQHRKMRHNLWCLTQFPTLLSHDVRKVVHRYWHVQNVRQKAMDLGFFKLRVPVDGFFYTCRYRDEDGPIIDGATILAGLPWNRWVWDLFESRSLHGDLSERLRADVDLDALPAHVSKARRLASKEMSVMRKFKREPAGRALMSGLRSQRLGAIACVLAAVALYRSGGGSPPIVEVSGGPTAPSVNIKPEVRVSAVGGSSAVLSNGQTVRVGDVVEGVEVRGIAEGRVAVRRDGVVVLLDSGGVFAPGQQVPAAGANPGGVGGVDAESSSRDARRVRANTG